MAPFETGKGYDNGGVVAVDKLDVTEAGGYGLVAPGDAVAVGAGGEAIVVSKASAHSVGLDSPWICAFHQVAALDAPFVLAYPYLILSALGWAWGSVAVVIMGVLSFYCNIMLASVHEVGGKRHIRYRDLSAYILGRWTYYPVWFLQYINLLAGNVALLILSGQFLKAVHDQYNTSTNIELSHWIIVAAATCALFTFVMPHLHHLRVFSGIALGLIFVFVLIILGISIHDGRNNGPKAYFLPGTKAGKIFNAFGAIGSLAFAYDIVIIPEIQATVRAPAVRNMYKAIGIQYCFAVTLWALLTYVGYWAYGVDVAPNILANLSGPKWAITVAQLAAFVQCIISTQIFAAPVYEALDTQFGKSGQKLWSPWNTISRIIMRGFYWALTAFVAALLPFFGDFVALIGAVAVFPCCLILPLIMTAVVHKDTYGALRKALHWGGAFLLTLVCIAAAASAVRFIIVDAKNFSVFANIGQSG